MVTYHKPIHNLVVISELIPGVTDLIFCSGATTTLIRLQASISHPLQFKSVQFVQSS